jgi:hypothetical protein
LPAAEGELEVRVDVLALAGEPEVELGGRVLLDGREIGSIAPYRAGPEDEVRTFSYAVPSAAGGALRLESALRSEGPEVFLRVKRVVVTGGRGN